MRHQRGNQTNRLFGENLLKKWRKQTHESNEKGRERVEQTGNTNERKDGKSERLERTLNGREEDGRGCNVVWR